MRRGADEYAAGVLIRLEGECIKALTSIKRGIDMLDERHRGRRRRRGPGSRRTPSWSIPRSRPRPRPGHDRVQRRRAAPRAARGDARHPAARPLRHPRDRRRAGRPDRRRAPPAAHEPRHPRCAARSRAPLRRTCARCTDPYVEDVRVLGRGGVPAPASTRRAARRSGRSRTATRTTTLRIDEHHEIDLGGVFHDELVLTEPMHPLCRPDCPGLCAECGGRLDDGDHAPRRRRDRSAPGRPGRAARRRRRNWGRAEPHADSPGCRSASGYTAASPSSSVKEFPRGRSQAKGFQGAPGRAPRASRDQRAAAGRVRALSRAAPRAPRLPDLRLVQRP